MLLAGLIKHYYGLIMPSLPAVLRLGEYVMT